MVLSAKKTFLCECISSVFVTGDTVKLEFVWPGPAPRGGQFFLVKPLRTGIFLGRPLSAAGWKPRGPASRISYVERRKNIDRRLLKDHNKNTDNQQISKRTKTDRRQNTIGTLQFFITRRGQGSRELMNLRPGEEAELIGPLGNFWAQMDAPVEKARIEAPAKKSAEKIQMNMPAGKSAEKPTPAFALVGGGVGIAPLLAYAAELAERPFDFYAGFRTGSYGLENIKPRSLVIATEDGSLGLKGRIPDFFTPAGYSAVFACGPEPMLKAVGDDCIANEIPCYISVERHMACGVGACLGCTVRTTGGNRKCCTDGPIFKAEEVCFD